MKKVFFIFFLFSAIIYSSSNFELTVHGSYWTADIFSSIIEENFTPDFAGYDAEKGNYDLNFYGSNFGIGFRYYPGGKYGSFSIGISYERNSFKSDLSGSYQDYDGYGNKYVSTSVGYLKVFPHSFNVSFRWDISAKKKFHPYFEFGFGIGKMDGIVKVDVETVYYTEHGTITDNDSEEMTLEEALDELEEEGNKIPIKFIPIVHIGFGIKGEIAENFYLIGEISIYDGLIFRGGVAYRF